MNYRNWKVITEPRTKLQLRRAFRKANTRRTVRRVFRDVILG